ncbi:hypothetical protein FHQ18_06835 [Deferribacter autotrophicus]|uniref:Uncharacterized protein n=1 Tax=Deferribacter autotrophicus TaxID=500465 RepID=A0A5A8F7I9_9BACT|nr:hypothetical protein [Deferribacter autotrophicus]KAA0258107.1 hypothetical protein FHQ18_06835 [Deferribacter autotrophicus]
MRYISNFDGQIDKESFNWLYKRSVNSIYPPIIARVDNRFYQLNNFDYDGDDVFLENFESYESVVNFSTSLYSNINLVELANILEVAENFKCNIDKVKVFQERGVKGKKNFEALKNILNMPDKFKSYIVDKNITLKYISLFLRLKQNLKDIVLDYIEKETPSVGDFRKLLNFLYDYSRLINIDFYDKEYFERIKREKNKQLFDVLVAFDELQKQFGKNVKIISKSNFETCDFELNVRFSNTDELFMEIEKIKENKDKIEEFFEELKDYDLC